MQNANHSGTARQVQPLSEIPWLAHAYVEAGLLIYPVTSAGAPVGQALRDVSAVDHTWRTFPDAGLAMELGRESGLVALTGSPDALAQYGAHAGPVIRHDGIDYRICPYNRETATTRDLGGGVWIFSDGRGIPIPPTCVNGIPAVWLGPPLIDIVSGHRLRDRSPQHGARGLAFDFNATQDGLLTEAVRLFVDANFAVNIERDDARSSLILLAREPVAMHAMAAFARAAVRESSIPWRILGAVPIYRGAKIDRAILDVSKIRFERVRAGRLSANPSWMFEHDRRPTVGSAHRLDMFSAKDRIIEAFGDQLRYLDELKSFAVFRDHRWVTDGSEACIQQMFEDQIQAIEIDARQRLSQVQGGDEVKAVGVALKYVNTARSQKFFSSMMGCLRNEPTIRASIRDFDADPWQLNTPSGIVDLRSGVLRPHNPAEMCRHMTMAPYDPAADCSAIESFMRKFTHDRPALALYLQLRLGSTLCALNPEQKAVILKGAGSNGKGLLMNLLRECVLGSYARQAAASTFMASKLRGEIRDDLVALAGSRLVITSEANANDELDAAMFKAMTGGDPIVARGPHERTREIRPTWKIIFSTNSLPHVREPDFALFRRIEVVPCDATILQSEADAFLNSWRGGEAGVLRWLVDGCIAWYRADCRITLPAEVEVASSEYWRDADPVRAWALEQLLGDEALSITANQALERFNTWATENGTTLLTQKVFGSRMSTLADLGINRVHDPKSRRAIYRGIQTRS